MSKWKCQRGPFRRGCLEIDESQNHVVNQLRVSTQEWRSGSEPCRECVLAPYQEEITYTLPRSRNRTQGRLLLFTSVRTLLQCLSDVFMIIWQDRRTHSPTHTHLSTRSTNPASVMHSFNVVKSSSLFWWGLWRALSLLMKAVRQLTIRSSAEEIHRFFHLFQVEITYKREMTWLQTFSMKTKQLNLALIMKSFKLALNSTPSTFYTL